jgi:hypothetical protein
MMIAMPKKRERTDTERTKLISSAIRSDMYSFIGIILPEGLGFNNIEVKSLIRDWMEQLNNKKRTE